MSAVTLKGSPAQAAATGDRAYCVSTALRSENVNVTVPELAPALMFCRTVKRRVPLLCCQSPQPARHCNVPGTGARPSPQPTHPAAPPQRNRWNIGKGRGAGSPRRSTSTRPMGREGGERPHTPGIACRGASRRLFHVEHLLAGPRGGGVGGVPLPGFRRRRRAGSGRTGVRRTGVRSVEANRCSIG